MPDPVTIQYPLVDGRWVEIDLHRVGHTGSWVLDLQMFDDGHPTVSHQHSIDGTPEVEVG